MQHNIECVCVHLCTSFGKFAGMETGIPSTSTEFGVDGKNGGELIEKSCPLSKLENCGVGDVDTAALSLFFECNGCGEGYWG